MVAKKKCDTCGIDPDRHYQPTTKKMLDHLKHLKTVDAKGLHRSEEGDWEAYEINLYQCPKCKRYFRHTHSEDWEPVGIGEFDTVREITDEEAERLL